MSSLFIIGNGFDLSHDMKTKYKHFHCYLKTKYPNAMPNLYNPKLAEELGGGVITKLADEDIGFIMKVICDIEGCEWHSLEESLGKIELANYISSYDNAYDKTSDDEHWRKAYFNRSISRLIMEILFHIPILFSEWVSTIELSHVSPKADFVKLLNKDNDLFLSFNYTKTLEAIYGIKNVCHIHGVQGEVKSILFGHGNEIDFFDNQKSTTPLGAENNFQGIHNWLRKNTQKALRNNKSFFDNLETLNINKIYSYGFSFSQVDEVYIEKICAKVKGKKTTWFLNEHHCEQTLKEYMNTIMRCGFDGTFDKFCVKS